MQLVTLLYKKVTLLYKKLGWTVFFCGFSCFHFTRKKRPRFDQKLPTGTSEQSSGGRLAKMWTRIVSIKPTCASRVLNDLGTTLFPLKLSFGEIDTKLELNPHTTKKILYRRVTKSGYSLYKIFFASEFYMTKFI